MARILQPILVCELRFRTESPAATCDGTMWLLPVETQPSGDSTGTTTWRIWILSTRLGELDLHPENESLLRSGGVCSKSEERIETDVFIVGGGNAAMALAARLKALKVRSVMADRNASVGDNWARRYDCMKFHIPTSFCELPYLRFRIDCSPGTISQHRSDDTRKLLDSTSSIRLKLSKQL